MRIVAALLILIFLPLHVSALEEGLSRRDAFLMIWEGILRPAEETSTDAFLDVPDGELGSLELTYAKHRGILEDTEDFDPDSFVRREDALLWLFRTRNVDDLDRMQPADLPRLLERYPVMSIEALGNPMDRTELMALIRTLDSFLHSEVHEVSFYADDFHGTGTAFGETFDMNALTAAHRTFPHGTLVKVTNIESRESVTVRINDRGPYVEGRDMDLSKAAFEHIAHPGEGIARVRFERLGDTELVGSCGDQSRRFQKRITRQIHFYRGVPHVFPLGDTLVLQANRTFVVRGVIYPDGIMNRMQDFVAQGEKYTFTPSTKGDFVFLVGTPDGRVREMRMHVEECS